jgi:hypothetical protein
MEKEQELTAYGSGESGLPNALFIEKDREAEGVSSQHAATKRNGALGEKRRETPEEFRARKESERKEKLEKKLERASKPETMLITRNAMDTNELVALINCFDFQFRGLRDRVALKASKVTIEVFQEQIEKNNALKDQIHQMCKELSAITGLRYNPPRGFK